MPNSAASSVTVSRAILRSALGVRHDALKALLTPSLSAAAGTVPGRILLGLAATLIVAAAAHVAIPLPFTPVPFILTPLAVVGAGLAFGPLGGFAVLVAYLLEGAAGLPVFSPTGPGGVAQLLGPTGGFLMSYPLVAFLAGLATRLPARLPRFAAATLCGLAAIVVLFTAGAGWLYHWDVLIHAHASLRAVAGASVLPFLPGEIVKVLAAAGIYSTLSRSR